ncbi:MAG: DUF1211 domain-containing protein [Acidimicrobiia bacterium]|nr:DUF1211 domain-containing protein [Acidimicrobiia bacterium]
MNKVRVEAFSDGVFAIAITLLVLTIAEPTNYRQLSHQIWDRWPSLAAYIVSFIVIGIMWLNHHSIFGYLDHIDRPLVYLNQLLLLTVVFLPYPTGVLGEALRRGEGTRAAAVFYSVAMAINAVCWAALWLYASAGRRLLDDGFPEDQRRSATLGFASGPVLYTLTIGLAFVNAYALLALHAALAVYYAVDPISRRAARGAG